MDNHSQGALALELYTGGKSNNLTLCETGKWLLWEADYRQQWTLLLLFRQSKSIRRKSDIEDKANLMFGTLGNGIESKDTSMRDTVWLFVCSQRSRLRDKVHCEIQKYPAECFAGRKADAWNKHTC